MPMSSVGEATRELHRKSYVVDICATTNFMWPTPVVDGQNGLDRALEGGIDCAVLTVTAYDDSFLKTLGEIARLVHFVREHSDRVLLAETVQDIAAAHAAGKLAIVLALQTGSPVEQDWLTTLSVLSRLGVRMMQVTYNERNRLGSGCLEPRDDGLTAYGRQVVAAMAEFGVLVDIAHAGPVTAMDVIALSPTPVMCSHANAAALTEHPRNLTDDLIKAVAGTGGVIGIASWTPLNTRRPGVVPTIEDYLDHLDYMVQLVGPEHVGLGLDLNENIRALPSRSVFEFVYDSQQPTFERMQQSVLGLDTIGHAPDITEGLLKRGYPEGDIAKILGGNFLRVAEQVWAATDRARATAGGHA